MSIAGLAQGGKRNNMWFELPNLAVLPRTSRAKAAEVNAVMGACRAGVLYMLFFSVSHHIAVVMHYGHSLPALSLG